MVSKNSRDRHISFVRSWKLTADTIYELGQCDAFVDALSNVPINPVDRSKFLIVSLIKGARATTAIEGNTLSEEEIARVIEGQKLPPSKSYQENEVKNILDALNQLMREVALDNRAQHIDPEMIKRFHYMVGKGLGEVFEAVPGKYRTHNVHVGGVYIPPDYKDVKNLVEQFCEWIFKEFHFESGQTFSDSILHAIVSHVYIAWIHPFGDGNGRTARLLEFYIMVRAGNPDFASHLLSNFYNETRNEYYHHLDKSRKTGDLSEFIAYAVRGYRDGLVNLLTLVRECLFHAAWENYVHEVFRKNKASGNLGIVLKRCRDLILAFPLRKKLTVEEIKLLNVNIAANYKVLSPRTIDRDLTRLIKLELLIKDKDRYIANSVVLSRYVPIKAPTRKKISK